MNFINKLLVLMSAKQAKVLLNHRFLQEKVVTIQSLKLYEILILYPLVGLIIFHETCKHFFML